MYRRQVFALAACSLVSVGFAGCLGDGTDSAEMDEGSPLISVTVDEGFEGTLQVEADCRDEPVEVPRSGERFRLYRQEDGESCSFDLYIDGEHVQSVTSGSSNYHDFTIDQDGAIEIHDEIVQN